MFFRLLPLTLSLLGILGTSRVEAAEPAPNFQRDVLPVLQSRCIRCHGPEEQNSDMRLDDLSTDLLNDRRAAENWNAVLNTINRGEMPPEDQEQLTVEERRTLTSWLTGLALTRLP